jgi:large subunit ribosomal protein L19
MTLITKIGDIQFGIADKIRVYQKIKESGKERSQIFLGTVIKIRGEGDNKTFTVRRIGSNQIGIERIFTLNSPTISKIEIVKSGTKGSKKSKLYYIRGKSKKEIEKIYSRASVKK